MQLCSINSIGADTEKKNDIIKIIAKPKNAEKIVNHSIAAIATPITTPINNTPPLVKTNVPVEANTASISTIVSPVKKAMIKTSTPSINPFATAEKKTDNVTNSQNNISIISNNLPSKSFTQQALEDVWGRYANDLKAKRANLASSLLSKQPVLKDEATIEFTINNKALEESINEDKMNFLGFLRKELNNYSIQLNLVMVQSEEKANLYTATDRYKHLAEKNPNINKFRQTFDLDIEF
jgi:DNA polymerase-3 subunit gamma/tau